MWKKEGSGWDAPCIVASWKEHGFSLDELNEVVNFYFEINKPSVKCKTCGGNGHHPDAQWITESWYSHSSPFTNQTAEEVDIKRFLERFGCENRPPLLGRGKMPPDELIEKYGLPVLRALRHDDGERRRVEHQHHAGRGRRAVGRRPPALRVQDASPTAEQVNKWYRDTRLGGRASGTTGSTPASATKQRCERLGVPMTCRPAKATATCSRGRPT